MEAKLSLQDIAASLAQDKGIEQKQAEQFVRLYFDTITKALKQEGIVKIKGLGTFKMVDVQNRESVNISTGERFVIPGHTKISFTPDTALKDLVNKPFAEFQTVVIYEGTNLEDMERIDSVSEPEETVETDVTENILEEETLPVEPQPKEIEEIASEEETLPSENSEIEETIEKEEIEPVVAEEEAQVEVEVKEEEVEEKVVVEEKVKMTENKEIERIVIPADKKTRNGGRIILQTLVVLILMLGSYITGYYRLFTSESEIKLEITRVKRNEQDKTKDNVAKPVQKETAVEVPSAAKDTVVAEMEDQATTIKEEPAKQPDFSARYPQVPGGKYIIVGVRKTRKMKVGNNLYKMAKEEYGDKKLAQYIIVLNDFKNPDCIPLNYDVKIPELKENK